MIAKLSVISWFLLLVPAPGQTALTEVPPGTPRFGWAVEVIVADPLQKLETYLGERGIGQVVITSFPVVMNDVANDLGVSSSGTTVHDGRAFFKADTDGVYTFAMRISGGMFVGCGVSFRIGDTRVLLAGSDSPNGEALLAQKNVRLAAGIYRTEYLAGCQTNRGGAKYEVLMRGPDDSSVRPFAASELFHMQR